MSFVVLCNCFGAALLRQHEQLLVAAQIRWIHYDAMCRLIAAILASSCKSLCAIAQLEEGHEKTRQQSTHFVLTKRKPDADPGWFIFRAKCCAKKLFSKWWHHNM